MSAHNESKTGLGIYVMDADGGHVRRVGDAAGDLSMLPVLAWRP